MAIDIENPGAAEGDLVQALSNLVNFRSITVPLTAEQIKTLHSSPVTIVSAPGSGKVIVPFSCSLHYSFGTAPFDATGSDNVKFLIDGHLIDFAVNLITKTQDGIDCNPISYEVFDGTLENKPLLFTSASDYSDGSIATVSKNAGGSGYAQNDTGTIDVGDGNATYAIDTVSGGAVSTFHITDAGSGYSVEAAADTTATSGGGSGFKVNILSISDGDGSLSVTVNYSILDVP